MFSCMKKSSGSEDGGMGAMFSNVIMDPEQVYIPAIYKL